MALALTMPILLLSTACGVDVCLTDEDDASIQNGYEFPVAINVAKQSDITRAVYNTETMRLSFNTGDHLLVSGVHHTAGKFAGELIWTSGVTFEGIIITEKEFTGTAYDLLEKAKSTSATLLPDDYIAYGYLSIRGSGCSASLDLPSMKKAFADTKAHGVEQLSYVHAKSYANGFVLSPGNAILSCTITGLDANKDYTFTTTDGTDSPSGTVTSDSSGQATFAVAFTPNGIKNYSIQIGDGTEYHIIDIGTRTMSSGCIYSIRTAAAERS